MLSVLAVDDSASMRQMVESTLQQAGYDVVCAEDGIQALAIAAKTQFDVVLTDVNMPNLDGISLTRELRGTEAFRFTPILVLTTESGDDMKRRGRLAGATGWIVKPFDPERLVAVVRRVAS